MPRDFDLQDDGSYLLLTPLNPNAEAWLRSSVSDNAGWKGDSLYLAWPFAKGFIATIKQHGFKLRED